MAYSELVKNFSRIREYMREFYLYGFKSREEYTKKSARSYDDERRRMESWLGDYMQFRQTQDGKNVFLSIDSRLVRHNPLYKAWKAKSFTDGDITLHFLLFDILYAPEVSKTLSEIMDALEQYQNCFETLKLFDLSTVRKKLAEYRSEGIILAEKRGKTLYYRRAASETVDNADMLDFFSEIAPCGAVGSFLLDKLPPHEGHFAFKHHYITAAMDSEIVCALLLAMSEKRQITMETVSRRKDRMRADCVVPLQLTASVQSGRTYLMAYVPRFQRITSFRTDCILSVKAGALCEEFDAHRQALLQMKPHIWGVSTQSRSGKRMEYVSFTVRYDENEQHIPRRLEREKRCGTVEHLDNHTSRFTAAVYDASEMIPWISTFLCRITELSISNEKLQEQFWQDVRDMYALYDLEGGEQE